MLAQHAGSFGEVGGICGHHAGITRRAQVFGGIEAEGSRVTQGPGAHPLPSSAPGLGCILDDSYLKSFAKTRKRIKLNTLAVEVDGENGANWSLLGSIQPSFHVNWVKIEGGWIDVGEDRSGSGAQNGADRGEETERSSDDGIAGADSCGDKSQPKGIGTGGAADGVGHAQMGGGLALEFGYRLTKDKLLRLEYPPEGIQQLLVERLVLALEVQHGDGLVCRSRMYRWVGGLLHLTMVSATGTDRPILGRTQLWCK